MSSMEMSNIKVGNQYESSVGNIYKVIEINDDLIGMCRIGIRNKPGHALWDAGQVYWWSIREFSDLKRIK